MCRRTTWAKSVIRVCRSREKPTCLGRWPLTVACCQQANTSRLRPPPGRLTVNAPMPYQTTTPTNDSHGHSRTPEKDPGEMPVAGPLPTCREVVQASKMPGSKWSASSVMPPLGALPTAARAARGHVRSVLAAWGMN